MRILDRYLAAGFLRAYFLASVIFIAIYQVVDLFEKSDEWIAIGLPVVTMINYYLNRAPEVFIIIGSLSCIMAVLFWLGRLVRKNEFAAMMAAGVSSYRAILPLLVAAFLVSLFAAFVGEVVAPEATRRANIIEKTRRGDISPLILTNLLLYGESGNIFFAREFNGETNTIIGLEVLRFSRDGVLEWRVNAEGAVWQNNRWVLCGGFTVKYVDGERVFGPEPLKELDVVETPTDFLVGEKKVAELTFQELRMRIRALKGGGLLPREELVAIHSRLSRPIANLIVVLISIPFVMGAKKVGVAAGFGGALGLAFIYLVLFNLGQLLGKGVLPPVIGAWLANIVFIVAAICFIKKTFL
ncbi:YjgP/YjgQ family permease [candidate division NPL-UPA2 bacterium Unc8]|uniref:YjgP/YjgQ family permease n=1 Tax=candidate division NPL-UPA2 bacterium Unc8 TaxID=1980939 RepID=A0A399G160_UNCN2|nr:MAG: YjgP/YjgQ family permease [candidate division NPL-UPA2 bacterium Unc8]